MAIPLLFYLVFSLCVSYFYSLSISIYLSIYLSLFRRYTLLDVELSSIEIHSIIYALMLFHFLGWAMRFADPPNVLSI